MARPLLPTLLVTSLLLLGGVPLRAQLPGGEIQSPNRWRSEYLAEVFRNVSAVIAQWRVAWENGDAAAAADLFTGQGTFVAADGHESRGRGGIRESFARRLRDGSGIELKMTDFYAGGELAFQTGRYSYPAGGPPRGRSGRYVAILQQEGRRWRIRSLHQYPDPQAPDSTMACATPKGAPEGSADTLSAPPSPR